MNKAQLPAIFSKITSRADRSYKIEFETRELSGQDATTLMQMIHNEGWMLFSPNPLQEADVPEERADSSVGQKTPSSRLRASLFKVWQTNGQNGSFETYYLTQMERIIATVQEKIQED